MDAVSERPEQGRERLRNQRASEISWALALGAPPAAAAALATLRSEVSGSALALLMVLVVVLVVTPGRRLAALVAGVSAGAWFDFFLTRPYESFAISRSSDIQTWAMLVVVGVAVGELAARERRHRNESTTGADALAAVKAVGELVADGAAPEVVTEAVREALVPLLHLASCEFDPSQAAVTVPYIERPGHVSYGPFFWDTGAEGLPPTPTTLPVRFERQLLGRFVLQGPNPAIPTEASRLRTATVLADLAGIALAKARPGAWPSCPWRSQRRLEPR